MCTVSLGSERLKFEQIVQKMLFYEITTDFESDLHEYSTR